MRKKRITKAVKGLAWTLIVCILCGGCASSPTGSRMEEEDPFCKMALGQSKDEVVSSLGEPDFDLMWGAVEVYYDVQGFGTTGTLRLYYDNYDVVGTSTLNAASFEYSYPGFAADEQYEPTRQEKKVARKVADRIEEHYVKEYGNPTEIENNGESCIMTWSAPDGTTRALGYALDSNPAILVAWGEAE